MSRHNAFMIELQNQAVSLFIDTINVGVIPINNKTNKRKFCMRACVQANVANQIDTMHR